MHNGLRTNDIFDSATNPQTKLIEQLNRLKVRRRLQFSPILISILSLLMISLLPFQSTDAVSTDQQPHIQYTDDERRILRHLFLKRFGLDHLVESHPPRTLDAPEIPDYIWQLYDEAQDNEYEDTVRHYFPTSSSDDKLLQFDLYAVNRRPNEESIEHADLRIQLPMEQMRGQLNVYDGLGRLLDSQHFPQLFSRDNWIDLDVTRALQSTTNNKVNFKLEFVPNDASTSSIPQLTNKAALVTYVQTNVPGTKTRRKRNTNTPPRGQRKHRKHRKHHNTLGPRDNSQCRKTKLYVDFSELKWNDWILAPAGYDAYQCQGRCVHPMPSHLNTTNHAIIQSLIHSIDPSAVPPPSCVPTETSSISILYRDLNNTVVVKTYADMKVEACGCH
ncbi:TGF-BETA-2 domain-containing protein [Aphelenchoides bicaudatus]|nr:TGF-BETA-2 domain-containing protein [Aphelenchoides bicaudatus]